ncbi:MAG: decaprenyl-phosphate phosphoribosyltransferase [Acidimicrobiaceae bacterium]|nr:decaprenyl-phosphate phosphoribosyltransferase [Acidimicrobiaceae bacterium]
MTEPQVLQAPAPDQPDAIEVRTGPRTVAWGLVRSARPRQWIKNVLVFSAPGAAAVLTHRDPLLRSVLAFVVFCLAASGTYLLNDAIDAEADRMHPKKRFRPIAAGTVSLPVARAASAVLVLLAVGTALGFREWRLALVAGIYVAITISYSTWLKDEPVIDLAAVASGFVLRAIAGGVAAHVAISKWFLIVAAAGSLFMVAGKRHAEGVELGAESSVHRATLASYSVSYLHYVRCVTSGVAMTAYCLWAFEKADAASHAIWFELSIVPFVLAMLRYALLLENGQGGAPEDVVLGDRPLQVLGVLWAIVFAAGVYAR